MPKRVLFFILGYHFLEKYFFDNHRKELPKAGNFSKKYFFEVRPLFIKNKGIPKVVMTFRTPFQMIIYFFKSPGLTIELFHAKSLTLYEESTILNIFSYK